MPFLTSTTLPVHRVSLAFAVNVATVALAVAFLDAGHHYRDWAWQTLIWLVLVSLLAGIVQRRRRDSPTFSLGSCTCERWLRSSRVLVGGLYRVILRRIS